MRCCAIVVCLALGIGMQPAWSHPLKSVFVTFPGDVTKDMSETELADVSSRWIFVLKNHGNRLPSKLCSDAKK